jgi:hypothetical protein
MPDTEMKNNVVNKPPRRRAYRDETLAILPLGGAHRHRDVMPDGRLTDCLVARAE